MSATDRIEIQVGDIVEQDDLTAIVNAANAQLEIGGGVAGAIHSKGDPKLTEETRALAPIEPGEAVITPAPNLPNENVIHCLGPRYNIDSPSDKLLADCYRNALKIAADKKIESVGFPAISTGAFGYPKAEAVEISLDTVLTAMENQDYPKKVRFVLFDEDMADRYRKALENKS